VASDDGAHTFPAVLRTEGSQQITVADMSSATIAGTMTIEISDKYRIYLPIVIRS
jgi:hypothetical protein